VPGTGGSKIKEIELATSAHVIFEKAPEPRMVVRGNETERAAAIAMVQGIIEALDYQEEKMSLAEVKDRTHVRAVLGVKGAFIRNVELTCGVNVRYNLKEEDEDKFVVIIGNTTGLKAARAMIEAHLLNIQEVETHEVDDDELRSLMGYKGQVVHRLEAQSGAIISMLKEDSKTMIIRGTAEQRAKAWQMAQDVLLNDAVETHEIPSQLRRIVVGPNGTVVRRVEADTGAKVTLLNSNINNSSRLLLRGQKEERAAAWKLFQSILFSEEGEEKVKVPRRLVSELLRDKAKKCKEMELASGTYISLVKEEETLATKTNQVGMVELAVRGLPEQREVAKTFLREMDSEGPEKHLLSELAEAGAEVSILDVRRIIGPRGQRVAELEAESGASIRLVVDSEMLVSVTGTREQKDLALALIRESLTLADQEMVPLPDNLHGIVIGVNGRSVQMIERQSGAQVSFKAGSMVLRGSEEQRAAAKKLVEQVLESEVVESLRVDEDQASVLIGLKGRNIRQVESVSGARVQVLDIHRYTIDIVDQRTPARHSPFTHPTPTHTHSHTHAHR
jgi:transcription antitermination factor NusA-like protein